MLASLYLRAMKPIANAETTPASLPHPDWIEVVRRHVAGLRYGVVQITVHGGKVVQVERTERFRFEGSNPSAATGETP